MQIPRIADEDWTLPGGITARLRAAGTGDLQAVRGLYHRTYGDRYAVPEVANPEHTARALADPTNYLWLVTEVQDRVVGSVIFAVDPFHRLGKAFGGVIEPEFRGQKIMTHMIQEGHRRLLVENGPCDLLYAVVRTFVSLTFHSDLRGLGYIDTGIFPNVRRVRDYETHGFKVCPGPAGYSCRRRPPRLFHQVETLYQIVASRLDLDPPEIVPVRLSPRPGEHVTLEQVPPEEFPGGIEAERERLRHEGQLSFGFYPLHEPNLMLASQDRSVKAFLYHQPIDGHASLLGMTTGGRDMVDVLESLGNACEALDVKYLEILASAYDPVLQAQLWQAYFIPSAWFPAARLCEDGCREDYLVASRTFVPLHFKGLKLTEESKPFILEYFKLYTGRLWEELVDA